MSEGPIPRGDLITSSGVGSMVITPKGVSVTIAGLDAWFPEGEDDFEVEEFKVYDFRLQLKLQTEHFRLPPDYRRTKHKGKPNLGLTIPVLRFPSYHVCSSCRTLSQVTGFNCNRLRCTLCRKGFLEQVPIVAICENGHMQDFPWHEWAHSNKGNFGCDGLLKLSKSGTLGLGAQYVSCQKCKGGRSLGRALYDLEGSIKRAPTNAQSENHCRGSRPWLGEIGLNSPCELPLHATLRTSGNVYYSSQDSAIYLPEAQNAEQEILKIRSLIEADSDLLARTQIAQGFGLDPIEILTIFKPDVVSKHGREVLTRALNCVSLLESDPVSQDLWLSTLRGREYLTLSTDSKYPAVSSNDPDVLRIEPTKIIEEGSELQNSFSRINLVHRLRETRVMSGFTRFTSGTSNSLEERKKLLWGDKVCPWLPATVVFGEGIFLEFLQSAIENWKDRGGENLEQRVSTLQNSINKVAKDRGGPAMVLTPEFVLAHTVSHLLINRFVYECGYQAASLRERLYIQPDGGAAAFLIYTADGDSEGTLGGLVKLGDPDRLEPILTRAIEGARWCSSDPVCQEIGKYGQGPDSLNLAACHSCAMVPETSCENFNKYLDRGLVIGTSANPEIGFFENLL